MRSPHRYIENRLELMFVTHMMPLSLSQDAYFGRCPHSNPTSHHGKIFICPESVGWNYLSIPKLHREAVDVCEGIINFIPRFILDVVTKHCQYKGPLAVVLSWRSQPIRSPSRTIVNSQYKRTLITLATWLVPWLWPHNLSCLSTHFWLVDSP